MKRVYQHMLISKNNDYSIVLPNNIKYLRQRDNITQQQLSELINISKESISKLEQGSQTNTQINTLISIADAFHVSLDYLLGRSAGTQENNEYITSSIGLSDAAIEVLKKVNNETLFSETFYVPKESIEILNVLIEEMPISNIFIRIDDYISHSSIMEKFGFDKQLLLINSNFESISNSSEETNKSANIDLQIKDGKQYKIKIGNSLINALNDDELLNLEIEGKTIVCYGDIEINNDIIMQTKINKIVDCIKELKNKINPF